MGRGSPRAHDPSIFCPDSQEGDFLPVVPSLRGGGPRGACSYLLCRSGEGRRGGGVPEPALGVDPPDACSPVSEKKKKGKLVISRSLGEAACLFLFILLLWVLVVACRI